MDSSQKYHNQCAYKMGPNVHGFVMVELEYRFEHGFMAQGEPVPVDDVSIFSPA